MKTAPIILALVAIITGAIAWVPAPSGRTAVAEDRFLGPEVASESEALALARRVRDLAITTYDVENAELQTFRVREGDQGWTIPSHYDYPADGGDRVGKVAGTVLGVEKQGFVTENPQRFAELEVVDPAQDRAAFDRPRGKRVTLKDDGGSTIVDLIIGKAAPQGGGVRYVREADSNRVYMAKIDNHWMLTTRFTDFVERDLLKVKAADVRSLAVDHHRVRGIDQPQVERGPVAEFIRPDADSDWKAKEVPAGKEVDQEAVKKLAGALSRVRLQGVRPSGHDGSQIARQLMLRYAGFFIDAQGNLLGNEGGIRIVTEDGMYYFIFFGELAPGEGEALTAGTVPTSDEELAALERPEEGDNRYMAVFPRYIKEQDEAFNAIPGDQEADYREQQDIEADAELTGDQQAELAELVRKARDAHLDERRKKLRMLEQRFERFFFVIADSVFKDLRPEVDSLFDDAPEPEEPTKPATAAFSVDP